MIEVLSEPTDCFTVERNADGYFLRGKSVSAFYTTPSALLTRLAKIKYVHNLKISDKTLKRLGILIKEEQEQNDTRTI